MSSDVPEPSSTQGHVGIAHKELLRASKRALAFIRDEYRDPRAEALEGHPISADARPVFIALAEAIANVEFAAPSPRPPAQGRLDTNNSTTIRLEKP